MSLSLNQSLLSAGGNKLLPAIDNNLKSWCVTPTTDGKTLSNIQGTSVNLKNVNCLSFDGTNDHIDLTNVIPNGSAFEIEVRVKCIANLPTNGSDTTNLFYQGTYGSSSGLIQCALRGGSLYKGILFRLGNGAGNYNQLGPDSDLTSDINDNDWHTYKFTFDGTDTMKIFFDGTLVGTKTSLQNPTFSSTSVNAIMNSASGEYGINCKMSDHITTVAGSVFRQLPLAEGSGTKAYDVSGNGGSGTIDGATWSTENGVESWNHEYGFDTDKFKGYSGYWDLANSASGTWTIGESSLSLTGNSGSSSRIRQTVDMDIGASLVVSGTVVQTGGSQGGEDLAISSSSVGWAQGSVFLGGAAGTYTFSTSLTAISNSCDVQFIGLNGVTLTIRDIKFTVVKKIPALNTKTKQVATTDGSNDEVVFPSAMDFEDNKQYSVTLTFDPTAGTDTTFFASSTSSISRFAISMANGDASKLVVTVRQSSSTTVETPISSIPSGMITLTASWDGSSTLTASYVDSGGSTTNFTSSSETGVTSGTARTTLGCRSSLSQHSIAKYLLLTITKNNTVLGSYDFQSDIGTTTIQDTTANNNDGTVTTGSGGLATFWGQRVADTAGSIVSADYAAGNTHISNPGGVVHNGSECGFETGLQELTSTEIFDIDNTGAQLFTRKAGTEITQFLEYENGLTGTDLTRTRAYVG